MCPPCSGNIRRVPLIISLCEIEAGYLFLAIKIEIKEGEYRLNMFSVDGRNIKGMNDFVNSPSHSLGWMPSYQPMSLGVGHNINLFLQKPFSFHT